MSKMIWQRGRARTIEAAEVGVQIETKQIDTIGTYSAPPLVQSIPPSLWDMPTGLYMISQAMCNDIMTRLATLEAKVSYMEGGVKH